MLHTIGARSSTAALNDLLAACHTRIRENLALAKRIAAETDHPLEEIREAAQKVRRYFALAFPLHVEDEELTIAPRLAKLGADIGVALTTVSDEHEAHRPLIEWLVSLLDRIVSEPQQLAKLQGMLAQTVNILGPLLEVHLEIEERVVFPALRKLGASDQAEIVAAMRARRSL